MSRSPASNGEDPPLSPASRDLPIPSSILTAAIEAANDSVVITDARGTIRYVNPAFTRITGWSREEVLGENPRILKSGHQDEAFYRRMWETLTAGRVFEGRFVNRRKDGSLYTQEATITPVRGPGGEIEHFVAVARDVTEEELLEEWVRSAERTQVLGQVAGGVAHDFRNILGILSSHVELAQERVRAGEVPRAELDEMGRAVEKGTDLVRKLLTLGGKDRFELATRSLGALVQELRPLLETVLPESVTVELRIPDEDPATVRIDPGALEQVIVNLATNARDALPGGGRVLLTVDRPSGIDAASPHRAIGVVEDVEGGWVRLRFRDDGAGMEGETLSRIFEPFFTTKEDRGGTGLGLASVARIVRLHGGAVVVSSRRGEGTTVDLYLRPAQEAAEGVEAEADHPGEAAGNGAPPRGEGERILVVEDEPALLEAARRLLERFGYSPVPASNGAEALEILEEREGEVDLVVTDLVMPGMGGKELFERMGVLGLRSVPVLFTSGYGAGELDRSLPPGAEDRFLEKPWSPEELARKVRRVLDGAEAARSAGG